ncbi:hypothetical protein K458DRAFT_166997 [Lentithecium fluviatile CBS 122367]|uniref:SRCR domain-containing protein n=1 Tax=Lentithecium fluviatile CBS 122367 TaxID=1168545 RepID=A0A6G1IG94_9PLEO|nr:hypothetical protein K458DRAFT_166997 [Lentithecium fluviatile CBS 122367]
MRSWSSLAVTWRVSVLLGVWIYVVDGQAVLVEQYVSVTRWGRWEGWTEWWLTRESGRVPVRCRPEGCWKCGVPELMDTVVEPQSCLVARDGEGYADSLVVLGELSSATWARFVRAILFDGVVSRRKWYTKMAGVLFHGDHGVDGRRCGCGMGFGRWDAGHGDRCTVWVLQRWFRGFFPEGRSCWFKGVTDAVGDVVWDDGCVRPWLLCDGRSC